MKNLLQFAKNALSQNEQNNVKGGIRFITQDKNAFNTKKKELKQQKISFMKEKVKDPITGINTYCIEW